MSGIIGTKADERVEIVRTEARLAEVGEAWTALWQQRDGHIFQSHGWVRTWWSTIVDRNQRALRIGLVWSGDELVAVVPLAVARRRGVRILEWAAASFTDYGDILIAETCSAEALAALWSELRRSGGFDVVALGRLLPGAKARALVGGAAAGPMPLRPNHRQEVSFRVAGPFTTGTAWLDSQSKKTRQNYRRGHKILSEAGPVVFRLVEADEDIGPLLARLLELKHKWLEDSGLSTGAVDNSATTLPALAGVLRDAGLLRIFVLECAGAMIAISLNFVQHGTMMAFVTTYDPAFERGSPGMVLMIDYIRWSIDNGLDLVDFLCGAEPFKLRFANQSVVLDTVVAIKTPLGQMAHLADGVREQYRQWRSRNGAPPSGGPDSDLVPAE